MRTIKTDVLVQAAGRAIINLQILGVSEILPGKMNEIGYKQIIYLFIIEIDTLAYIDI